MSSDDARLNREKIPEGSGQKSASAKSSVEAWNTLAEKSGADSSLGPGRDCKGMVPDANVRGQFVEFAARPISAATSSRTSQLEVAGGNQRDIEPPLTVADDNVTTKADIMLVSDEQPADRAGTLPAADTKPVNRDRTVRQTNDGTDSPANADKIRQDLEQRNNKTGTENAQRISNLLTELNRWFGGRNTAVIEKDLRDKLASMNSSQIAAARAAYLKGTGRTLDLGLLNMEQLRAAVMPLTRSGARAETSAAVKRTIGQISNPETRGSMGAGLLQRPISGSDAIGSYEEFALTSPIKLNADFKLGTRSTGATGEVTIESVLVRNGKLFLKYRDADGEMGQKPLSELFDNINNQFPLLRLNRALGQLKTADPNYADQSNSAEWQAGMTAYLLSEMAREQAAHREAMQALLRMPPAPRDTIDRSLDDLDWLDGF